MTNRIGAMRLFLVLCATPLLGGCLFVAVPVDINAGPGASLKIADGRTGKMLPEVAVLVERYRIEGPMHAAPVIRLEQLDLIAPPPGAGYALEPCMRVRRMWLVWMPEVRHSPDREVTGVKVVAPGFATVWLPVEGPLDDLDIREDERGRVLYMTRLDTPEAREKSIDAIARHGWPPGPKPVMADVIVPPDLQRKMAPLMVNLYERLLRDHPAYVHADRVRLSIRRWAKLIKR